MHYSDGGRYFIKGVLMKLLCKMGMHKCDSTDIRYKEQFFISSCRRCGEDVEVAKPTKAFLKHLKSEGYAAND